ncbi:hypothetical protein BJY21_004092 [Kineosphaera limosa]|uniref:UvrD-like helicase ATP-binding domain-containing protein n=1 Tax=Kineosphaera limosa NBRC 100340 TaxID=1184609 RepID=K6X6C4_9MICO|nr:RNA polymerase recycling motor ATPase HelR [Kineosphaera limosa]NYE02908.1 hypothetical protein [Kineosphaera limosa]GAB94339.1 hypothetical protein KILIM_004_01310 [Kineosphaera limosa NBRC 100340]
MPVTSVPTSAFALPDRLAKADPALLGGDEGHFAAISWSLQSTVDDLTMRLEQARRAPAGAGQQALDRDLEVHRLTQRLRALRRFGLDLCLGRMDYPDGSHLYIGRLGLKDDDGRTLLIDWRTPAAEPFFAATHANPMGLVSRRRYRWTRGRITDYWDEVFDPDALDGRPALDEESAFIASLGGARTGRMRDVLSTIQADQDAIIRASSSGPLVVDGGPGTGKTVVALHRTAYLLYADPRLGHRRGRSGGVLFVGPHEPYLAYVADVLPSLGEEGVRTCTVADLLPEGASALPEADPQVAALKSRIEMVAAIDPAVRFYEEPPEPMSIKTEWGQLHVDADDWAEAFDAPAPGTPHNEAREQIWEQLIEILLDKLRAREHTREAIATSLRRNTDLVQAVHRGWPLLEATDVVGDLWSVPAYLRMCAPWLTREQVRALQREDPQAWTTEDLPILDAARARLGDPEFSEREQRAAAERAAQREERENVMDHLIEHDDTELQVMSMLTADDLQSALDDDSGFQGPEADPLAGPFGHVVVDEAQELTDAQWQMLLARCPSRSFTIVGDRAQARHGFAESWQERLERVGFDRVRISTLSVNYRTPAAVMAEAEPVIRAALPDANVPTSIRTGGEPVLHGSVAEREQIVAEWLAQHPEEGTAAIIGDSGVADTPRVRSLTPETAKGLEFDLVVLIDPQNFGDGIEGAVDRYVAMTRATGRLAILTS